MLHDLYIIEGQAVKTNTNHVWKKNWFC